MTKTAFISTWLPLLRELAPPAGLILVGAGAGISPWAQLLQEWNLPGTILVEPDDAQFVQLQRNVSRFGDWRLHKQLVAGMEEEVIFYQASNSAESGLLDPESLRGIWPNIRTRQRQTLSTITLAGLQREEGHSANWLMVDCLPALPIVQGAAELLDAFDVIAVRVVFGEGALGVGTASHSELEPYLSERGYRCIATETGRHPAVGHALYVRDTQAEIRRLRQQQVQQKQAHLTEIQELARENSLVRQLVSELEGQISQLTEAKRTADKLAAECQQQIQQLKQANATQTELLDQSRAELNRAAKEHGTELTQITQAYSVADKLATERLQKIEQLEHARMQAEQAVRTNVDQFKQISEATKESWAKEKIALTEALTQANALMLGKKTECTTLDLQLQKMNANRDSELVSVSKSINATIKKEIHNAVQQIEAFLGVQAFLNNSARLPAMHDWPISPDLALYLIDLIGNGKYDLIIEFGSGSSTLIMAEAIARINSAANDNAPVLQVAFEHLEEYYLQTQASIQSAGLAHAVKIFHVPLEKKTEKNGNTYYFYSCGPALEEIKKRLASSRVNILVLVDGPPEATGKHSRYPALPVVLSHFPDAVIDIVLDDYIRNSEKEIVEMWLNDLSSVGRVAKKIVKKMEKDACRIIVS